MQVADNQSIAHLEMWQKGRIFVGMNEEESLTLLYMLRDAGTFDLALEILRSKGEWLLDWLTSMKQTTIIEAAHPFWREYRAQCAMRAYDGRTR